MNQFHEFFIFKYFPIKIIIFLSENTRPTMDNNEDENLATDFLISIFPKVDPEFLQAKLIEFGGDDVQKNAWVQDTLENNLVGTFPTRTGKKHALN